MFSNYKHTDTYRACRLGFASSVMSYKWTQNNSTKKITATNHKRLFSFSMGGTFFHWVKLTNRKAHTQNEEPLSTFLSSLTWLKNWSLSWIEIIKCSVATQWGKGRWPYTHQNRDQTWPRTWNQTKAEWGGKGMRGGERDR